jgi:predicted transcriptional regulator
VRLSLSSVLGESDFNALKTQEMTARIQAYQREQNIKELGPAVQRYFRQKFPTIKQPETVEGIIAILRDVEPRPEQQAQKLAVRRVELVRERLSAAGTDAKRLEAAEKNPPPDTKGDGRIEFSVVP